MNLAVLALHPSCAAASSSRPHTSPAASPAIDHTIGAGTTPGRRRIRRPPASRDKDGDLASRKIQPENRESAHAVDSDPRSRDRAVDQQRPRGCAGARPRPPPPPDDGLLARVRENAESRRDATLVRAIALSISSIPVAAPAPGHDPPPPPDDRHLARVRENAESRRDAADPRSRDRAVDQQRPRGCAGARPRPPPPPDDGLLARVRENAESRRDAGDASRPIQAARLAGAPAILN